MQNEDRSEKKKEIDKNREDIRNKGLVYTCETLKFMSLELPNP